jgi:hypothetical protein
MITDDNVKKKQTGKGYVEILIKPKAVETPEWKGSCGCP